MSWFYQTGFGCQPERLFTPRTWFVHADLVAVGNRLRLPFRHPLCMDTGFRVSKSNAVRQRRTWHPAQEYLTMTTVGFVVGSHSFFPFKLSFLYPYIVQILCQTVKNFFRCFPVLQRLFFSCLVFRRSILQQWCSILRHRFPCEIAKCSILQHRTCEGYWTECLQIRQRVFWHGVATVCKYRAKPEPLGLVRHGTALPIDMT